MSYELSGAATPPMSNGELDFDAPWQGRVFSMAVALAEAGVYDWSEFQARLIAVIDQWDHGGRDACRGAYPYYELFQQALEELLADRGLVVSSRLAERSRELAGRPHGHDH